MKIQTTALLLFSQAIFASTPLEIGPHRDVTISSPGSGITEISISGPTPHFWTQPVAATEGATVLAFEYFSPSGIDAFSVRFRDTKGGMIFAGSQPIPLAETWQPFAITLTELPTTESRFHLSLKGKRNHTFQLRHFRLRKQNQAELEAKKNQKNIYAKREADGRAFLDYLQRNYEGVITAVDVGTDTIHISGTAPDPVQLVELPPHISSHQKSQVEPYPLAEPDDFSIILPRFEEPSNRDRATSRWRLETPEGRITSHAKWPTKTTPDPSAKSLSKAIANSQKGIGGVPIIRKDDHPIFELGAHHATVNFVLDALISSTRRSHHQPWKFEGHTYYVNQRFLAQKNATIRRLCENDMVVTCILLVGNGTSAQMKHPDAQPRGVFAMPNLTTEEAARHYRAAIHFLTSRYATPGLRISNWVIHNEIDQAGTWTNMGDQPLPRYLDAYTRSARLVYHTARQHDPFARVFISLTHHWAKQSSGHGTYTVRDLLDLWSEIAQAEGSFDWGVAYHPYPQDLRNPDTWDDTDVSFDFDTPYITPKNIEVLPAYLGPHRPILLSEQGFNTPTLSLTDQKRQAAGLIYMFRKLRNLPTVEAYHLHRYQDMPDREGGLRLGIMDENGNRKIGWHTYTAIGTDEEAKYALAADEILPDPIPVKNISVK